MKNTIRILSLFLLGLLVFLPFHAAAAKDVSMEGQVVFGQSFTLSNGEVLNGDLLVFGGSVMLAEGSRVDGDVVLFGGSLVANGEVTGEVVITGGTATLGATAHLYGDLTTIGGSLNRAEGARIDGNVSNTVTSWDLNGNNSSLPTTPSLPKVPGLSDINFNFHPIQSILGAFGQAVGFAILAMLLMLFLAPHADRTAHAVIAQPLLAGGLGLLTLVVTPIVLVLLTITIILIPVTIIAAIALAVAIVFGWIAIGYEIGQRFTNAIHQSWHPAFSAGLGVFALTLVARALSDIPVLNCVGWLVPFLLGLAGLGAVIMTRFGTQAVAEKPAKQADPVVASLPPVAETPVLPPAEVEPPVAPVKKIKK